jgi:Mrp family chromosome partitioning ATPase/capsular polysaccharide biosynthesis protein
MNSTLSDYVLVLRRWWRILAALTLLSVTATALYFLVTPTEYESRAVLFVSTPRDDERSYYEGDGYAKKRADTYFALSKSPEIAQRVIDDLGLDTVPQQMIGRVNLSPIRDTVLLQLTTTGDTPLQAQAIGNAYVEELRRSVNALESVSGGLVPRVDLVPVQPPTFQGRAGMFPHWMIIGAAAALGLIAGALGAVVVALLDGRIRRAGDAAEATGTAVLATFRSSVPWEGSDFQAWDGESGRQLRRTLDRLEILGSKVIMVASAEPGAGKTGVALAAARALADRGSTVALVDFDSRSSRLASALGLDNPETVGALVRYYETSHGRHEHRNELHYEVSSSVQTLPRPNWHGVSIIPFGSPEEDQGSTADHPGTASLVGALRNAYDWVVVDTPAVNEFSDAVRLAHHADAVVLTAKAGRTEFDGLRDVCNQLKLAGGHVLGVVFVDDNALGRRRGFLNRSSRAVNDVGHRPVG